MQEIPKISLPYLAIQKPVSVLMMLLAVLVVGYIALKQIAVELMPVGFNPAFLWVQIPYGNANPSEVEEQIAKPLEEQIRTVQGVRNIETKSGKSGCTAMVNFSQKTDMKVAYAQMKDRMDRLKSELPEDAKNIFVYKWSEKDRPIVWAAVAQNTNQSDPFLILEQHLQKPIERMDGVAKVEISGLEEKTVWILVNQDRVNAYKLNFYEIMQKLRKDNFSMPAGFIEEGEQKIWLRSVARYKSLEEIQNLPIRAGLVLKDIADIEYDTAEDNFRHTIDGKTAVTMAIYKESIANTARLSNKIKKFLLEEVPKNPKLKGFQIEILFNEGDFIQESIDNLVNSGLWGAFFAILILYAFLKKFRMTMIVTMSIPLSLMMTIISFYFMGWTLNLITMMGLMISIGMVVDNSIVVVENIYCKLAQAKDSSHCALWGTQEVALAITMSTMTTAVVFLPLILMNDEAGFRFYMLRLGMPVTISLLASLLVSMVFIPVSARYIVKSSQYRETQAPSWIIRCYQKVLCYSLSHRIMTLLVLAALMASMFYVSKKVPYQKDEGGNINDVVLFFDLPYNYTMAQSEKLFARVEKMLNLRREMYSIKTIEIHYRPSRGQVRIFLLPAPKKEWYEFLYEYIGRGLGIVMQAPMNRSEIIEDLKKRVPRFPGVEFRTNWQRTQSKEDASVSVMLYGEDTETLSEISQEVERRLKDIPEIISIENDREKGDDEILLSLQRERSKKYGIAPGTVAGTIQYALRGLPLSKFYTQEKEIQIYIQMRKQDRRNLLQLKNMLFYTSLGKAIPLETISEVSVSKGFGGIQRRNGKTFLRIKINTTKDDIGSLYKKIDHALSGMEMPFGYFWNKGEGYENLQERNTSQMFGMILSITCVFLLMGILFESFVLPFSVIISIPFSFVGAYWIMYITQTPIDIMSQIGFIILVGVVVNNAIVLIDFIHLLRSQGYSRDEAIRLAGQQRFRPIMMTALTTIFGLLPMAIGDAKMIGMPYAPMGRTMIGGMISSTLISLIAVPWAYTLLDDMRGYFKKLASMMLEK